jgi:hypothetical protein
LTPFEFDYVEGMALGYIDGWSMEDTKPDVDLSQVAIERAPKAALQVVHRVHKYNTIHNGTRPANIVLRRSLMTRQR